MDSYWEHHTLPDPEGTPKPKKEAKVENCLTGKGWSERKPTPLPRIYKWGMINARINGLVFGHPDHPQGENITTSRVEAIYWCHDQEKRIVITQNSIYELEDFNGW